MGSTNSTVNYSLSQFVATDKPAWLQDYNGDMLKIDTAIKAAKTAADTAQTTADTASSAAGTNASAISALQTTVSGLQTSVTNMQGSVNTIESLIGNGVPTTNDRTIIGAINEINAYRSLRKVGRVDVSLAATNKASFDTVFSFLNSNFNAMTRGKLVFSTGTTFNFEGPVSNDFRATLISSYANGNIAAYTAEIANGTSAFYELELTPPSTIRKTDISSNSNASVWCDVYVES